MPDRVYAAVAVIRKFCHVEAMPFEEALGRLKVLGERTRHCTKADSEQEEDKLLLTTAQWAAWSRRHGGGVSKNDNDGGSSTTSGGWKKRRGRCYNYGQRGHFEPDCLKPRKAVTEEQAMLAVYGNDFSGPGLLLAVA
ncbi:hypothetical protein D1007_19717 [Hordeum vulgare]|nr:hypothetical protein D1007_19717 [Hordeum vulgare]